ncbi:MAG: hypothetical protein LBU89_02970 [Fibromonadaceae bacterium]|nr:hypothetical protein [Fibromonadaceae bacterium]
MPQITATTKLTAIAAALLFCVVTAVAVPSFGEEEGFDRKFPTLYFTPKNCR